MYSFFEHYFRMIHKVTAAADWCALCNDKEQIITLIDRLNAQHAEEAQRCFLDGVLLGKLLAELD
ncbi:hypothetical protein [Agathobaculum sp.]|uniref:hypothetical protein n=1 Tax=Agathobaculum sp. TaxID=2048138 RepID=UPI002A833C59|nr:hypothetical protein [Agathobaculum sp.]MDY3618307.1 hypothetical protein [Agathobaculum sp.]